jgi:hypothetical protein
MPRCEKRSADELARLGFRKGKLQRGADAQVQVQVSGTQLVVRGRDGKAVRAQWDSGDPVGSLGDVYLSDDGKLVAIEYAARQAGRSQSQVVALRLRGAATAPDRAAQAGQPAPGASAKPAPPDDPEVVARVRAGDKQLARKRWKQAEQDYRGALALAADHPAARYGLAAALAGQKRSADAIAELVALGRSAHPQAPRWLVEARLGRHFTGLQAEPAFRRAVGIDREPGRAPSAYERLVGQGGHWEQTGAACQDPTVTLRLDRKSEKFQLTIRNRCQGEDETTQLAGQWRAEGASSLRLRFPNPGGRDEELDCQLAASDKSGEDSLSCTLEDLTFAMRVVRR